MNNINNAQNLEASIPIEVDISDYARSKYPDGSTVLLPHKGKEIEAKIMHFNEESGKFRVIWEKNGAINSKNISLEELDNYNETDLSPEKQRAEVLSIINSPSGYKSELTEDAYTSVADFAEQIGESGNSKLLDGENAKSLADGMRSFGFADLARITASTDIGVGKTENQDRVMINSKFGVTAVIDGIGGEEDGGIFAQIFSEELGTSPLAPIQAAYNALEKAKKLGLNKMAAACFMSARLHREDNGKLYFTDIVQAGDVKMIILDDNGDVYWSSRDQSLVDLIANGDVTYKQLATQVPKNNPVMRVMKERSKKGQVLLSKDEAIYSTLRSRVVNYVGGEIEVDLKDYRDVPVKKGYRMIMTSDGVSDNFTNEEIADLVRGKSAEEGMIALSESTTNRMLNGKKIIEETNRLGGRAKLGKFSDGFKTLPKANGDNRGVVIEDVL